MCWRADTRLPERELRLIRTAIRAHVRDVAEAESDAHVVEQIAGELIGNVQRYAPGPFCAEAHWVDDSLELTPATTAEDVEGWDSMNHIFIVVELEKRLGVKFQAAEMEELKNVGELAGLVKQKLARRG